MGTTGKFTGMQRVSVQKFIKFGIVLIALVLLVHIIAFYHVGFDKHVQTKGVHFVGEERYIRKLGKGSAGSYKILYWLPFNNVNQMNYETKCMETCPVKCELTDNKEDIDKVDMVNFHLTDLWTENWKINTKSIIKFPSYRRPDQVWTLTNLEPPPNLFGNLRVFNGIFNWTLWYRKDATVHLPYGLHKRLNAHKAAEAAKALENRNFFKEKTGEVTGVISNCKDSNRRYRFVKELGGYLNVTMFGYCYNKICGDPLKHASCDNVTSKYKFYLALENSKCKDYVTEKYWQSLNREQIPIVNWDLKMVNENIPVPGSFISISDFKDVKSLADYLKHVSTNETLYNSYFDWRKQYSISGRCPSCIVCQGLHEGRHPQVIEDLDGWVRNDVCDKVELLNSLGTQLDEFLFWKLGV
ncbi:alpha-(1,3)-fucosyltransferase 7-like [Mercenaria mercenaria]|uniref:alpha-(1,3)-fucosyltransferase 7-like n=1 Tax=Mercenaria mercenaria TaxID=6596 RepID=UPI00234E5CD9|nr:alpha-(1,3)-fucosyltransferase 7-like [Mercenaria mercenaria]